jgi:hypothetical protein
MRSTPAQPDRCRQQRESAHGTALQVESMILARNPRICLAEKRPQIRAKMDKERRLEEDLYFGPGYLSMSVGAES